MSLPPPVISTELNSDEKENIFAKYILEMERRNMLHSLDVATHGVKNISDEDFFKILMLSLQINSFDKTKSNNTKSNNLLKQSKSHLTWISIMEEFRIVNCTVTTNELSKRWTDIISDFKKKINSFKRSTQNDGNELSNLDLQIIYNFPSLLNIGIPEIEKKPQRNSENDQFIDLTDVNSRRNNTENTSQDKEALNNLKYNPQNGNDHCVFVEQNINNDQANKSNDDNIHNNPDTDIVLSSSDDEYISIEKLPNIKRKSLDSNKNNQVSDENAQKSISLDKNKNQDKIINDFKAFRSKNKYKPFHKLSLHNLPKNHWSNWWKARSEH